MKVFSRSLLYGLPLFALMASTASAQVKLQLLANYDLSPTSDNTLASFIGNNPSALVWNGSTAWVGGYNNGAAGANTGIVRIDGVLTATPTIGTAFGLLSTPSSRGLTGLALFNNRLAAGYDNGSGSGDSVRLFDTTTNLQLWRIGDPTAGNDSSRRASGGVAFDPGFNGANALLPDVAYTAIGSGRRHRLNQVTGMYVNGQNSGAIINFPSTSTTWRHTAFDPATGDLYTRESNRVGKAVRTADNSFGSGSMILVPLTTATFVDNQNLAFCNSTAFGKFLIFNDKQTSGNGQVFLDTPSTPGVVKAATAAAGAALSIDLGSFAAPTSAATYDFSFDAPTQTLAITDFGNRRLFVFRVGVPVSVTGKVNFVRIDPAAPDQQVTFEFRPTGNTQFRFVRTATVPVSGNFTFSDIPPGTYTLHVKTTRYLAKNVDIDASATVTLGASIDQLPGDINGDNAIDFGDLSAMLQVYNALSEDPLYATQPLADLNQDGGIDFGDLSSMLQNYNVLGDD